MITTEEALLRKLTETKPKSKEPRADFLARLLEASEKLDDSDWEKMGQEPGGTAAQQWCNDAVDARKADKDLPDFVAPEDDASEDDAGDDAGEDDGEEEKVTTKTKAKKSAKAEKAPAKAKAEKTPAKAAKGTKPKPGNGTNGPIEGIKVRIKDLVIDDPQISLEDLLAKLSKGGDKMSRMTVSSVRSETRHTLRVLKQKGKLKGVEI